MNTVDLRPAEDQPGRRRNRSTTLAVVAALVSLTVVVGVIVGVVTDNSGHGHPAATPAPRTAASTGSGTDVSVSAGAQRWTAPNLPGVRAVLARMNSALAAGDERGFLADVDARSSRETTVDSSAGGAASAAPEAPSFRQRQQALFRALHRMPFAWVRYSWTSPSNPDDPDHDEEWLAHYGPGAVAGVALRQYRLAGWDDRPVAERVVLVFVPQGGGWVLADELGSDVTPDPMDWADGFQSEPWTFGDIAVARAGNVLVVADPGQQAHAEALAGHVSRAIREVDALWSTTGWNHHVVVYALTSTRFVRNWFGSGLGAVTIPMEIDLGNRGDVRGRVADVLAAAPEDASAPGQSAGHALRIVLAPGITRTVTPTTDEVIRHELTHVATWRVTMTTWLREGVAEYTANRVLVGGRPDGAASLSRHVPPVRLPAAMQAGTFRLTDLGTWPDPRFPSAVRDAYAGAWLACQYIVSTRGESALRRFIAEAGRGSDRTVAVDAALRDVLHVGRETFERDVTSFARRLVG